jgi:hypothetical protein
MRVLAMRIRMTMQQPSDWLDVSGRNVAPDRDAGGSDLSQLELG